MKMRPLSTSLILCAAAVCAAVENKSSLLRVCYYIPYNLPFPGAVNASLCTHIIAGFANIRDGQLTIGNKTQEKQYLATTALKKQNPDLKVLITVGGGGKGNAFSGLFDCVNNRTRFIFSVLAVLRRYNFDGLDVDWEFPVWNDDTPSDRENFVHFIREFHLLSRGYSHLVRRSPALLTVAVAAPQNIIDIAYDVPEMAKYVDFINLMSYDFHDYHWYFPFTGHNSPLFNRSVEGGYFATLNTAWSAYHWLEKGMPKSKIMVGIPTYSHNYQLGDPQRNAVDDLASGSLGEFTFSQVCDFLASGATRVFDNQSQVPYAYKDDEWISYEDQVSIAGKAKWIVANGFGGAMTYDLNNDDWESRCDNIPFLLQRTIYDIFTSSNYL